MAEIQSAECPECGRRQQWRWAASSRPFRRRKVFFRHQKRDMRGLTGELCPGSYKEIPADG